MPLLAFLLMAPQVLNFAGQGDLDRRAYDALPFWRTLEGWEISLLDSRFRERGVRVPRSRSRIAIVAIDELSLASRGQWPFPRGLHAELIKQLRKSGARVIGFDIGFDGHQGGKFDAKTGVWTLSEDDRTLAQAIKNAGNVALVSHVESGRKKGGALGNAQTGGADFQWLATPIDEFDEATPDVGVAYVARDNSGGMVRRYPFRWKSPTESAPFGGFAPLCAAMYRADLNRENELSRYQGALRAGRWPAASGAVAEVPLHQSALVDKVSSDEKTLVATTPLWFWGASDGATAFPTYSYADVLKWTLAQRKAAFAGRIVLVGATAPILKDVFWVPAIDAGNAKSELGEAPQSQISGVEIHATMIAMLLDGQFLRPQNRTEMLGTLFLVTLAASVWTTLLSGPISTAARRASAFWVRKKWPGHVHDAVWFGLYAGFGALPLLLFWRLAVWELSVRHQWIIAAYPLVSAIVASMGTLLLLFGSESAQRRKTETQMARIVAPDVMEEILAHPEAEYPRPRRVFASILFTDLDGFTAYAAAREPEEVVRDLNALLTRIHPIVSAHGGSVDKYIGDSVMAFFGAPIPRDDHAAQALRCAIALQDECARFRLETGVPFWMRIGVHSGEVLVGSVGSEQYFNYTVIGDAVNMASRLESKNKEFGSRILCSAQILEAAPDVARVRNAQTWIRGKAGAVEVFLVSGPHLEAPRGALWGDSSSDGGEAYP